MFWENPYDTKFEAKIIRAWQDREHVFAILNSTLFYPEGGGQPSDNGVIRCNTQGNDLSQALKETTYYVEHVLEKDGKVIHVMKPEHLDSIFVPKKGQSISGEIDWVRRFDFMQQHTGQHILSRAFEQVCGVSTVGFHLSINNASIDLDVDSVKQNQIIAVEDLANQVVFNNLDVNAVEYDKTQLPSSIRKRISFREGLVRIIQIGDFDVAACGGTHVSSTGEVGVIKVDRLDRAHKGVRVMFKCGRRAFTDLRAKHDILAQVSRLLSVGYAETPSVVSSLQTKISNLNRKLNRLTLMCQQYQIEDLKRQIERKFSNKAAQSPNENFQRNCWMTKVHDFAVCKCTDKQPNEVGFMARSLCKMLTKKIILFSSEPRFSLAVALPKHHSFLTASKLSSKLAQKWGLRGGGSASFAQIGSKQMLNKCVQEIIDDISIIINELTLSDQC